MTGKKVVQHMLVLPSWDPTGKAASETLYRIGTKTKKLYGPAQCIVCIPFPLLSLRSFNKAMLTTVETVRLTVLLMTIFYISISICVRVWFAEGLRPCLIW